MRHQAALELLRRGAIGPEEALLAVVWPRHERLTDENVPRERQFYSAELREEIRRRHGKGETLPELAQKTGISYASLKGLLNDDKARVATGETPRARGHAVLKASER